MATRQRPVDRGAERGRALITALSRDVRDARRLAGLSQRAVGEVSGVSESWISRFEAGFVRDPGLVRTARVAAVVGLDLTARVYPSEAGALRDAGQARVLERFKRCLHTSIRFRTEVPLPIPGDQRAWDSTITASDRRWRYGVEVEVRPVDGQAITRRVALKRRDGGMDGVIPVLPDTRQTRAFLREFGPLLAEDFHVRAGVALTRLAGGSDPGGSAVVVV